MNGISFNQAIGAILALSALGAVIFIAIYGDSNAKALAVGSIIGVAGGGSSYFLGNYQAARRSTDVPGSVVAPAPAGNGGAAGAPTSPVATA